MGVKIKAVSSKMPCSEGPFWDEDSQSLYFVNVFENRVCRYVPSTNTFTEAAMPSGSKTSFIIGVEGQKDIFLIGNGNEVVKIKWDGVSDKVTKLETIADLSRLQQEESAVWNDAKIDSKGQLWVGYFANDPETIAKKGAGGLYTLISNKTLKKQLSGLAMANGMGWVGNKYYFIDTFEDEVMQFDYKAESADITNKQVIFKCNVNGVGGLPDGMTIDNKGNIWFATFGGQKIVNIDPKEPNIVLQTIEMPVPQITSCTFGGPNMDEMYVTTAGIEYEGIQPDGGYLYLITGLNVRGVPSSKAKLQ